MKKPTHRLYAIVLLIALFLLIVGCTSNREQETLEENIKTIESVIRNALSGPNDELKEIINSEGNIMGKLLQYEKERFEDYFANDAAFMDFLYSSTGSIVLIEGIKRDYNFKVINIEFEAIDSEEIIYDFTVELQYQKEGSEKSDIKFITGQTNLDDNHKIEVMLIRIDELLESL